MFGIHVNNATVDNKVLITSRGFSGTIYLLSLLSSIKNTVVAWQCTYDSKYYPNGITAFGGTDIQPECFADENDAITIPLNEIYSRMIHKHPSCDLYSIGHLHNLHDAEKKYGYRYFRKNNILVVNLIRHPIDRTYSNWHGLQMSYAYGMPDEHKQGFIGSLRKQGSWLSDFIKKFDISLQNKKNLFFIGACLNLFGCALDASYKRYQHVAIDSLTKEELDSFLTEISREKITLNKEEITNLKVIENSHTEKFRQAVFDKKPEYRVPTLTHDKFMRWSEWQQELYRICIKKSKLNKYYKKYNYQLYL